MITARSSDLKESSLNFANLCQNRRQRIHLVSPEYQIDPE